MMTETQRAALMAAEDAFRRESDYYAITGKETKARENMALAGKMAAALAEPGTADTPTGWLYTSAKSLRKKYIAHRDGLPDALRELEPIPLYTRPQRREPLTDERIHNLDPLPHVMFDAHRIEFARAIEAAHGIGAKP